MLLHRLLLQIIRSEIFVADLQGFALDVSIVVCGIDIRKADESAPRKRRRFCCITKKRPANFRGGPAGGLEASQIFVVGELRLDREGDFL